MKTTSLFFVLCLITTGAAFAQKADTIWYDAVWQPTRMADSMVYYRVLSTDKKGKPIGLVRDYYRNGQVQMEGRMLSLQPEILHGTVVWYHPNGEKSQECQYKNGNIEGSLRQWDETGALNGLQYFRNGVSIAQTLVDKQCYAFSPDSTEAALNYLAQNLKMKLNPDFETALLLDDWGAWHDKLNDYQNALNFFLLAASLKENENRPLSLALTYNYIAFTCFQANAPEYARIYLEKAAGLQKAQVGEEHPEYLQTLENLNYVEQQLNSNASEWEQLNSKMFDHYNQGDYATALQYATQALAQAEKEFGTAHENYATSCNNLALLYKAMGWIFR